MRIQGIHHLALQARDVERVTAFYRDVLGLPEQLRHHREDGTLRSVWLTIDDRSFLAVESAAGAVEPQPFRTDTPGWLMVALRIGPEDRAAAVERLAAAGYPLVHQTKWTVYVRDPEGNRVALSHHPHDPAQ